MKQVRVRNVTDGTVLAERAQVASTFLRRGIGLIGRKDWSQADGLVIRPCSSVHCLFMSLAIDAVFVGADDIVRKVVPNMRPWTLGVMAPGAKYVVELPAGTAAACGTSKGHQLIVEPRPNGGQGA